MDELLDNSFISSLVGMQGQCTSVAQDYQNVVTSKHCAICTHQYNDDLNIKMSSDDLLYRNN